MKRLKHHWSCPVITHGEPYLDNCYCEEKAMKKLDRENCACTGCSKERSAKIAADIAEKVAQAQQQFAGRGAATLTPTGQAANIEEHRLQEAVARKEAECQAMMDELTNQLMKRDSEFLAGTLGFATAGMPFEGEPSVCQEADKVIKDRHETYGSPIQNFEDIAALWDVAFGYKMTEMFTASDVAQAMRLVKEARLINDPAHRDSLVDICGYAQCQNEVNNGELVDEEA